MTAISQLPSPAPSVVIAGLVPAIHLASAWTTGTSPVVTTQKSAPTLNQHLPLDGGGWEGVPAHTTARALHLTPTTPSPEEP